MRKSIPLLLFLAVGVGFLYAPVFEGLVFYQRDIYNYWRPHIDWVLSTLARGEWVGWNPGLQFGMPFLADPNFQMFYPPTWLLLLFSPDTAYSILVLGHAVFGGLGAARVLSSMGFHRGATVAALTFALSGPFVSMASLWHHYCGAAWLPWVLWAARQVTATRQPSWRPLAIAFGLQALAGSAESLVMSLLLVVVTEAKSLRSVASLRSLALAFVVAGGIAALQWFPTARLFASSARKEFSADIKLSWSLPPRLSDQLVIAGDPRTRPSTFGDKAPALSDVDVPLIASPYLGAFALALALSGARSAPGLCAFFLATLAGSMARYLPAPLPELLTVLPFRYPTKVLVLSSALFSILAGIGADRLLARATSAEPWKRRSLVLTILAAGMGAAVSLPGDPTTRLARTLLFFAAGLLAPLTPKRIAPALLALGIALDSGTGLSWVNEYAERTLYSYRPPAVVVVHSLARAPRVFVAYPGEDWAQADLNRRGLRSAAAFQLSLGETVYPPHGLRFGIRHGFHPDFSGLGVAEMKAFDAFLSSRFRSDVRRYLDLGAIDAVISTDNTNPLQEARPFARFPGMTSSPVRVDAWGHTARAGLARRVWAAANIDESMKAVSAGEFVPGVDVALEGVRLSGAPERVELSGGTASIRTDRTDRVEIEVDSRGPGLLVLRDALRAGWSATVNGASAPIHRADVLFRGVEVPSGRSVVVFSFTTPGLTLGAVTCLLSLALLLMPALGTFRR